jgi:hypothetical protein
MTDTEIGFLGICLIVISMNLAFAILGRSQHQKEIKMAQYKLPRSFRDVLENAKKDENIRLTLSLKKQPNMSVVLDFYSPIHVKVGDYNLVIKGRDLDHCSVRYTCRPYLIKDILVYEHEVHDS